MPLPQKLRLDTPLSEFPGGSWNRLVDAYWDRPRIEKQKKQHSGGEPFFRVKNTTGATLKRGEVVELGDFLLDADELIEGQFCFNGDEYTAAAGDRFGIVVRGIPDGDIGPVVTAGICIVSVDVQNVNDRFAFPEDSSATLKSGPWGPIKLFNTPSGTGVKEVVGMLFDPGASLIGVLDADLLAGGTATMSIYTGEEGSESDSGENIEVSGWFIESGKKIASGSRVGTKPVNGVQYVDVSRACPVDQT